MKSIKTIVLASVAALGLPLAAQATPGSTVSGTFKGVTWTATSRIIGQTSTATVVGGGDPIYLARTAAYRGVVGLLLDYGAGGQFVCSGSLNAARNAIITAAHCVNDAGKQPGKVTAFFYNGSSADPYVYNGGAGITQVKVDAIKVNPLYTGDVIDQNDIAILKLASAPPSYAQGYDLYLGDDLTGLNYNVAGYGGRSDTGGSVGVNLSTGRLRQGDNRYDFRLGDPDFEGFFTPDFFGGTTADLQYSYIADFDNGLEAQDASCRLATEGFGIPASGKYCNLGRGATEVSTAGGDSGGPQFINGKLASVTSYGLTFGSDFGDIDDKLNDTFGELNGFVPIFLHADFLAGVPEPATWALMIGGFGLVGTSLRRQRKAVAA